MADESHYERYCNNAGNFFQVGQATPGKSEPVVPTEDGQGDLAGATGTIGSAILLQEIETLFAPPPPPGG